MNVATIVSAASLAAWLYLLFGRGHFWCCTEQDGSRALVEGSQPIDQWPSVAVILPARDEADLIAASVGSLLRQDYPGVLTIVVVDDQSTDGTATLARETATRMGATHRLAVIHGTDPPLHWTGKLWAMAQGIAYLDTQSRSPNYVLFTDADIVYGRGTLRQLVEHACACHTVLASTMVKLHCETFAERMLIPAFVFFFQKLYPFAWVNDPRRRTAAAAGGCMLVRPDVLRCAGGIQAICGALIDDCALGALLKREGPIWLGLTDKVRSVRAAPTFSDVGHMVARSAYAQLRYSPLLLLGTLLGMGVVYIAPPLTTILGERTSRSLGLAAWMMMVLAYAPTLRFFRVNRAWGLALPVIASMYMWFTLDSALQHWQGRGGAWKGRFQAARSQHTNQSHKR
ncbi:glycosyltransferase [Microvirga puerhi]|uniref:Glycosyltransferase n=1 Tax=Microvirga puerhi TaxID=2876078 RepID=A0ABS7VR27_9HYPH|nr:glycosyltransferase [Microvirga puerhi]MBZ6077984.1 glycosyltransferase [Microvirga puerhi]